METQPISLEVSRRISALRFPLTIGVIFIYSRAFDVSRTDYPSQIDFGIEFAIQWFLSEIVARVAVPLFFAISGYLFYSSRDIKTVSEKWIQRAHTLLWPYLLWNGLLVAVQTIDQTIPGASSLFSEPAKKASDIDLARLADFFLGFDQGLANGPLWFLRDLITLSILAPVYRLGLDRTKGFLLLLPFATWYGVFGPIYTHFPISAESVSWYGVGLALASPRTLFSKANLDTSTRQLLWLLLPFFLLATYDISQSVRGHNPFIARKTNYIFGAIIAWHLAGKAIQIPIVSKILRLFSPGAFFVYLSHAPFLQAIKESLYLMIQPTSNGELLVAYFLTALVTLAILGALFLLLDRYMPHLLAILTGRPKPKSNPPKTPA